MVINYETLVTSFANLKKGMVIYDNNKFVSSKEKAT